MTNTRPSSPLERGPAHASPHAALGLDTPAPASVQQAARARAAKVRTFTAVSLLSALAGAALVTTLGQRFHARADLTSAGEHQLSPRTRQVLGTFKAPPRVVIATDMRTIDPRARTNLEDVLAELRAGSAGVKADLIDTGSPSGLAQFTELVQDLRAKDAREIDAQVKLVRNGVTALETASAAFTDELSPGLLALKEALPADHAARAYADQAAAALRVRAEDVQKALSTARDDLAGKLGDVELPSTEHGAAALRQSLQAIAKDAATLAREVDRIAQQQVGNAGVVAKAHDVVTRCGSVRDGANLALEELKGIKRLDIVRVAETLKAGNAGLVIGGEGEGLVAMDLQALLPSAAWIDAAQAGKNDLRRRVEDIVTTSLGTLRHTARPIVVLTHGEARAFLLEGGFIDALRDRLFIRGIDCVEWAAAVQAQPDLSGISDAARRPVVYVTLATSDSTPAPAQGAMTGAQRAAKLAETIATLVDQRKPVLLSLGPSMLPTYGERDPLAKLLDRFGVDAMTGTPLLTETLTQRGRLAETDRVVQGEGGEEGKASLAGAVRGLPTYLTWVTPLERSAPKDAGKESSKDNTTGGGAGEHVEIEPLLSVPAGATTWAESEWLRLRSVRREERVLMPDPPSLTGGRDLAMPQRPFAGGTKAAPAWTAALTIEVGPSESDSLRASKGDGTTPASNADHQRLVVVGSNDWFLDQVTQQGVVVDGRPQFQYPGNMELLDTSVLWLAGHDDLIAQSPAARAFAVIRPIPEARLRTLRLALVLGLPGLVLAGGAAWLMARK